MALRRRWSRRTEYRLVKIQQGHDGQPYELICARGSLEYVSEEFKEFAAYSMPAERAERFGKAVPVFEVRTVQVTEALLGTVAKTAEEVEAAREEVRARPVWTPEPSPEF